MTILSVLTQDYPDFEYLVIDGGSTDNSIEIIRKYESKISFWVSEPDKGFGEAIRKGFQKATGEIICWVNSDDLLAEGALMRVGTYFRSHKSTGLVYGDRIAIDQNSGVLYQKRHFFYLPFQLRYMTIPQECAFWRRDIYFQSGGIDESLNFAIDFDLWCRISRIASIRHIPFFVGVFRYQPESKSSTIRATGKQERRRILVRYFGRVPPVFEVRLFKLFMTLAKYAYNWLGFHRLKIWYYEKYKGL